MADIHHLPKCVKTIQIVKESEILTFAHIKDQIRNKPKNKNTVKRKIVKLPYPPKIKPDEGDIPNAFCGDTFDYSPPGEKCIQYMCENWVHAMCSDYKKGVYVCYCCGAEVLDKLS